MREEHSPLVSCWCCSKVLMERGFVDLNSVIWKRLQLSASNWINWICLDQLWICLAWCSDLFWPALICLVGCSDLFWTAFDLPAGCSDFLNITSVHWAVFVSFAVFFFNHKVS